MQVLFSFSFLGVATAVCLTARTPAVRSLHIWLNQSAHCCSLSLKIIVGCYLVALQEIVTSPHCCRYTIKLHCCIQAHISQTARHGWLPAHHGKMQCHMLTMHVAAFAGHEVEQPEVFWLNICSDTAMMHAGRAALQLQGMKQNKVSGSMDLLAEQVVAAGAGPEVGQAQVVQLNSR